MARLAQYNMVCVSVARVWVFSPAAHWTRGCSSRVPERGHREFPGCRPNFAQLGQTRSKSTAECGRSRSNPNWGDFDSCRADLAWNPMLPDYFGESSTTFAWMSLAKLGLESARFGLQSTSVAKKWTMLRSESAEFGRSRPRPTPSRVRPMLTESSRFPPTLALHRPNSGRFRPNRGRFRPSPGRRNDDDLGALVQQCTAFRRVRWRHVALWGVSQITRCHGARSGEGPSPARIAGMTFAVA